MGILWRPLNGCVTSLSPDHLCQSSSQSKLRISPETVNSSLPVWYVNLLNPEIMSFCSISRENKATQCPIYDSGSRPGFSSVARQQCIVSHDRKLSTLDGQWTTFITSIIIAHYCSPLLTTITTIIHQCQLWFSVTTIPTIPHYHQSDGNWPL